MEGERTKLKKRKKERRDRKKKEKETFLQIVKLRRDIKVQRQNKKKILIFIKI